MRYLLILVHFLVVYTTYADQPRVRHLFTSENKRFHLKPSDTITDNTVYTDSVYDKELHIYKKYTYTIFDKYHWGLYDIQSGQIVYKFTDESLRIETKTVFISNDGQEVIIIDDFMVGTGLPDNKVLNFFSNGKPAKTYMLKDLINSMCSLTKSVSHTTWLQGFVMRIDGQFEIKNNEYRTFIFGNEGTVISQKMDERVSGIEIISGKLVRISKNNYELHIYKSINSNRDKQSTVKLKMSDNQAKKIYNKRVFSGIFNSITKRLAQGYMATFFLKDGDTIDGTSDVIYNMPDYCEMLDRQLI